MFGCDAVWERFLPAAYEDVLASATQFPPDLLSKKAVFLHLSRGVLLHNGTQAHWLDQATGGVCYSVAARGLRIVWGENEQYWSWFPVRGSRWPEIAHLDAVCWFHVSGELSCLLPAGAYTLSWRLKLNGDLSFQGSRGNYGWSIRPVDFSLSLCNDTQASQTQRYLTNEPGISTLQEQLQNLTPVRLVNNDWMEYDAGEIIVEEGEKGADLKFEMKEIVSAAWKGGVMVDGVVLRPTSLARAIGQSLTVAELQERFLQDHEDHEGYEDYEDDEFDEDDEYDEGEEVAQELVEVEEEDTTAAAAET